MREGSGQTAYSQPGFAAFGQTIERNMTTLIPDRSAKGRIRQRTNWITALDA